MYIFYFLGGSSVWIITILLEYSCIKQLFKPRTPLITYESLIDNLCLVIHELFSYIFINIPHVVLADVRKMRGKKTYINFLWNSHFLCLDTYSTYIHVDVMQLPYQHFPLFLYNECKYFKFSYQSIRNNSYCLFEFLFKLWNSSLLFTYRVGSSCL